MPRINVNRKNDVAYVSMTEWCSKHNKTRDQFYYAVRNKLFKNGDVIIKKTFQGKILVKGNALPILKKKV